MSGEWETRVLNLSDPAVREMAERHHEPDELWNVGGTPPAARAET